MTSAPALVALTAVGAKLGRRIQKSLPGAELHGLATRIEDSDVPFTDTRAALTELFQAGRPIIGICATGILIRMLAPQLSDKQAEPPVLAVSPDGSSVVPLLGGHHGANDLARTVASITGGTAALTTAGESIFGIALDDPPAGWRVANPERAKEIMAALLAGESPALVIEAEDPDWLADLPTDPNGTRMIRVSDRAITPNVHELLLHPPTLAVGVGCERDCEPEELAALVRETLEGAGLASSSVAALASIDVKADEIAVHSVADELGVAARFFTAAQLEAETPRLENPSEVVFREVGAHGVAEAAALAAAGPDGVLVVAKHKSRRATCAVARATTIDPNSFGRARGHLSIVGTGPGDRQHRIPPPIWPWPGPRNSSAMAPIWTCSARPPGKTRHDFDLGAEIDRCRHALDLAGQGRNVALVSSGDPGVFAMATLVFELLDREANPDWARIAIDVHPGVSAMQLAAARAGAPLGHDFCAISLSDLLTPWPAIQTRLKAAAEADFVVALYNPRSRERHRQIETARDILRAQRPDDTPVIVARNLAREGEHVEIVALGDLKFETIDMLTVVIVGNSQSRRLHAAGRAWAYTPRGYERKRDEETGQTSA